MRAKPVLLTLAVASVLSLSACSGGSGGDQTDPGNGRGIDARSYYDDYASAPAEDRVMNAGSGPSGAAGPVDIDPGITDDNTFVDAGTSGAVDPDVDPLSTFALDVDSGSYTVARTLLTQHVQPPAASIRAEEWLNAFPYDDPAPTEQDLGITVDEGAQPASTDGTRLVRVGISARDVADADRPPVALTMVVDTSGSMDIRNRLGLVKSSLALLAGHLRDDDTIALVTYGSQAHPLLEPTPVSDTDTILDAIDSLRPGGSTNLEAGLRTAYAQAREAYSDDAINAVILASDGVANVGTTSPDALVDQIVDAREQGIHLVTVGYGMGNYNDHLMEQLADQGDGFYRYVDTYAEAQRLFVQDFTSTLTPVARDAKAQVDFDPAKVSSYRLVGYDNRAIADDEFRNNAVDAGELGAGHHVTALYEVTLADGVEPGTPIGTATVRWRGVDDDGLHETTSELTTGPVEGEASRSLMLASTVADLAELLKGTDQTAVRGITLEDLALRAADLEAAGVDGADELTTMIDLASSAR
jgi:Ca-activated chloride channel family protein